MTEKLKMVEKGGKKVPFYAADGVGKMQRGGKPDMQFLKQMRKRNAKAQQVGLDGPSRMQRRGDRGRQKPAIELPTIGMRDAEGGAMMRQQFQEQGRDTAQRGSRRRPGPGMFGDRRLGGMFSGNRGRRDGVRQAQRAVMEGMGMRGPTGIREGGLVKIASEKSKAKTKKMERRGYGAARKP